MLVSEMITVCSENHTKHIYCVAKIRSFGALQSIVCIVSLIVLESVK
jgi:hypothetical protein